jgi:hypothetical protein
MNENLEPTWGESLMVDAREKQYALYLDDFADIKTWKRICEMFDVPTDSDQIYFNTDDITYGVSDE